MEEFSLINFMLNDWAIFTSINIFMFLMGAGVGIWATYWRWIQASRLGASPVYVKGLPYTVIKKRGNA